MASFQIFTDSSCDLTKQHLDSLGIGLISYLVNVSPDPDIYLKENIELTVDEFYDKIRDGSIMPKTSMPSIGAYTDEFKKTLRSGVDILCITLTSKFSGSYSSANISKTQLEEEFPGRKIMVVDSKSVAGLQGMMVLEANRMLNDGLTVFEVAKKLELMREKQFLYITVDSLKYLQKGGRIGHVSAFAGALLNIKPVIALKNGELMPFARVRGRQKAINELITLVHKDMCGVKEQFNLVILQGDALEESLQIKNTLENDYGYNISHKPFAVGPTIGSHIGPTVLGIGYMPKYEFVD